MINKIEKEAIERATSNLNRQLILIGAHRHFDEARDEARKEERHMRQWGKRCGIKFARGYSVSLAADYHALKAMLELVTGARTLPDLADTLDMPRYVVIGCQLFARYEKAIRNGFAELSQQHMIALMNFKYASMSEAAA